MKNTIITVALCIFTAFSCSNTQKNNKSKNSLQVIKGDSIYKKLYISVSLDDTLLLDKKHKGMLKLYHPLQDSIKYTNDDMRFAIAYLNVFESNRDRNSIKKNECDSLFYQAKKLNDTIFIPFRVTPKKIGHHYLRVILEEEIFLEGYQYKDSTQSRVLLNSYNISEDIYVKK